MGCGAWPHTLAIYYIAGNDMDVRGVPSCEDLLPIGLANAQDSIDAFEALTPSRLDSIGSIDIASGAERALKRDLPAFLKIDELDCSGSHLNALFKYEPPSWRVPPSLGRN